MEQAQEDLKAHLMATSEEFRQVAAQHAEFHKKLEALEAKPRLTAEDEVEGGSERLRGTGFGGIPGKI